MLVYKFGGASVKDAEGVRNLTYIVKKYDAKNLVVVVSAMAKTTNGLEELTNLYVSESPSLWVKFDALKTFHYDLCRELFDTEQHDIYNRIENIFNELSLILRKQPTLNFDFDYDQIVSFGEILSTKIIAAYLNENDVPVQWKDIRKYLKTDSSYREAKVDWELSTRLVQQNMPADVPGMYITQGFLGSTTNNLTTTLGREGSDYTAAILAHILDAEKVIIWKDVPGVLNADPKWFDDTELLPRLSYLDAIELAYYGASVIHPKTIQPLQNKNIRLFIKSFLKPDAPGTEVANLSYEKLVPSFIFKIDQVLLQVQPRDFSFIAEDNLEIIFKAFASHGLRINLMQNTAIGFRVCINNDQTRIPRVLSELEKNFKVTSETALELITIRYYDDQTIARVLVNKSLLLEQKTRQTIQLVVKDLG